MTKDKELMYYGVALLLLLPILFYLFYMIINEPKVHGCGSGCRGQCRMGKNAMRMKDLGVIFVKMEGCIHCQRLQELLENNKVDNLVKVVDSNSPKVAELMKEYGEISGFPTLISIKTKKMLVGGRAKIEDILNDLS
jgi:glutaredoxin